MAEQRAGAREQLRIADLMSLAPGGDRVLEIGARDCYLSRRLTALYREVTALDLRKPEIDEPGIVPVQGDVTALDFADGSFGMEVRDARLVGRGQAVTNPLSVFLYRLCGYPYGSYAQEEGCVHCGAKLVRPEIGPLKWAVCFPARALNRIQYLLYGRRRPLWIHVLFEKKDANRIKTE